MAHHKLWYLGGAAVVIVCSLEKLSVAYLGFHFWGGGVQNFVGKVGVFAWRSAWQSHAFARGVRGHAPPRKFLKMVQFGAF